MRTATLVFDRIPVTPQSVASPGPRHVMSIAAARRHRRAQRPATTRCSGRHGRPAGLEHLAAARDDHTRWVQSVPATCRIRLVSRSPNAYKVYLFWVPWLAAEPYVWLNMRVTNDPRTSTFHLGATQPVLPGGRLTKNGRNVNRLSVDTTLLSRYGAEQAKKGRQIMLAHGGDVFAKPGASCEVLKNGAIRLRSVRWAATEPATAALLLASMHSEGERQLVAQSGGVSRGGLPRRIRAGVASAFVSGCGSGSSPGADRLQRRHRAAVHQHGRRSGARARQQPARQHGEQAGAEERRPERAVRR